MPVLNTQKINCKICGEIPLILKGKNRDYCPACHVVNYFKVLLTHTKGKWAGVKFTLLPWQEHEILRPLFGTIRPDGLRQHRFCYCELPKKQGKSEIAAGLALYALDGDDEMGAEVYGAAGDREQAGIVYRVAAQMVRNNKILSSRLKLIDSQKRIVKYETGGFYHALSKETATKHGLNPSGIIIDELHAHKTRELFDVLIEGTEVAREQQLVFIITTAGIHDQNSIGWQKHQYAQQVKKGIIEDPAFLPVIYGADKEKDNWEDEEVWKRVNPSLGHIFDMAKLRKHYQDVKNEPARINNFMRYRLNMWVAQATRYIPMDDWDACSKKIKEDDLIGRKCWAGMDLSATTDLTAFVLLFEPLEDGPIPVIPYFFMPGKNILEKAKRDGAPYDMWEKAGLLTATEGNIVDYNALRKRAKQAKAKFDIQEIGYDEWNATHVAQEMQDDDGMRMVIVRQGYKTISQPTKEMLKLVLSEKLAHGGHPVLRWCADNLMVTQDPAENVKPAKDKSTGRIDGISALITALSRMMVRTNYESVYKKRGFIVI